MSSDFDCGTAALVPAAFPDGLAAQKPEANKVAAAIAQACDHLGGAIISSDHMRKRLLVLQSRLQQGQLQLAIVGQFKRGKSTLLNALLGTEMLPSAVTPLTAIPTFIRYGARQELHSEHLDGTQEDLQTDDPIALRQWLAARVTEDGNPHNRAGYRRVEVVTDAPLLREGIVLIDTPGVGSTYRHNTETAKAALPECDMALFVVSPDPPITEVEIAYLKELKAVTDHIVMVLNKIDIVDEVDRSRSEKFLSDTVAAEGVSPQCFFSLSGRNALAAKRDGDSLRLTKSGLPRLESYLMNFAHNKSIQVLETSVARKAAALIREAIFEVDAQIAIRKMPVAELSDKLGRFGAAGPEFERERKTCQDILAGDRARLLSDLDARAAALRQSIAGDLLRDVDAFLAQKGSEDSIMTKLQNRIPHLFQSEFEKFETNARDILIGLLRVHQERADRLIQNLRHLASTLLEIPYMAPAAEEAFQAKRTPYWVTTPREYFTVVPNVIDSFFPWRAQRIRDRLRRRIDEIITRNVENLRWSIRQNLETSIRIFRAQLDERLKYSQDAILVAMEETLRRRSTREAYSVDEIIGLDGVRKSLAGLAEQLDQGA